MKRARNGLIAWLVIFFQLATGAATARPASEGDPVSGRSTSEVAAAPGARDPRIEEARRHTVVLLKRAVPLRELVTPLLRASAPVISFDHGGPTRGGYVTGGLPVGDALREYAAAYEAGHGDGSTPRVLSFRVAGATHDRALRGMRRLVARKVTVARGAKIAVAGGRRPTLHRAPADPERIQTTSTASPRASMQTASKTHAWMPDRGTLWTEETSEYRFLFNELTWDTDPSDTMSWGHAFEHDIKLYNPDADCGDDDEGADSDCLHWGCPTGNYWIERSGSFGGPLLWDSTYPSDAAPYLDSNYHDPCQEMDVTIGLFEPRALDAFVYYRTWVQDSLPGPSLSHTFNLGVSSLWNDCYGADNPNCPGLTGDAWAENYHAQLIPACEDFTLPGRYSWVAAGAPEANSCASQRALWYEPIGYWRLDDEIGTRPAAVDDGPNHIHGSYLSGVRHDRQGALAGHLDEAIEVTNAGSVGAVRVDYDPLMATSKITAEGWLRTTGSTGPTDHKVMVGRSGAFALGLLANRARGTVNIGGITHAVSGGPLLHDGRWHHLALTKDDDVLRLYVDGDQVDSVPALGSISSAIGAHLHIGSLEWTGANFHGDVDEVVLFNKALPEVAFEQRFKHRWKPDPKCPDGSDYVDLVCASGPIGYWRLGESSMTASLKDHTGLMSGRYETGSVVGRRGAIKDDPDSAATVKGRVEYEPYGTYALDHFTAEGWYRGTSSTGSTDVKGVVSRPGQFTLGLLANKAYASTTIGGVKHEVKGGPPINDGSWHHLAVTYDGAALRVYVDAEQVDTKAVTGRPDNSSLEPVNLGHEGWTGSILQGDVDEVAIHSSALSRDALAERVPYRWRPQPECPAATVHAYVDLVCASKPIGYWRVGEAPGATVMKDYVQIKNGQFETGTTLGKQGAVKSDADTAATVKGRVDYEQFGTYAVDRFTAEGWYRGISSTGSTDPKTIIGKIGTYESFNLALLANKAYARMTVGTTAYSVTGGPSINDGRWHHLATTYDGAALTLYLDGKAVGSTPVVGKPVNGSLDQINVGYLGWNGSILQGDVDEVALYDRALPASAFAERFAHRWKLLPQCPDGSDYVDLVCQSGPIGYWRVGEASTTAAMADHTGIRNGFYETGTTLGRQGAIRGDTNAGATVKARVDYEPYGTYAFDTFSAEGWMRTTSSTGPTDPKSIIGRSGSFNLALLANKAYASVTIAGVVHHVTGGPTVNNGRWHHLAVAYDGTTLTLYLNGDVVQTKAVTGKPGGSSLDAINVGYLAWNGAILQGDVDEVALYDKALTEAEIDARFAYRWKLVPGCPAGSDYVNLVCSSAPVGYWRLGEAAGSTTMRDHTGVRNGTYNTSVLLGRQGALAGDVDTALGNNPAAETPRIEYEPYGSYAFDSFTVEGWVRTSASAGTSYPQVVAARVGQFTLGLLGGKVYGKVTNSSGFSTTANAGPLLNDGVWHHVAVRYDGSAITVYADGQAVASQAATGTPGNVSYEPLWIGSDSYSGSRLSGEIDEVAAYDKPLGPFEIMSRATYRR